MAEVTKRSALDPIGISPATTRVLVSTAYGSSIVAATLSPSAANKAGVTSRVMSVAECGTSSTTFPVPNTLSLVPGFVHVGSDENGASEAGGMVALTLALMIALQGVNIVTAVSPTSTSNVVVVQESAIRTIGVAGNAIAVSYLSPNVVSTAVSLMVHRSVSSVSLRVVGCVGVLYVAVCFAACIAVCIDERDPTTLSRI